MVEKKYEIKDFKRKCRTFIAAKNKIRRRKKVRQTDIWPSGSKIRNIIFFGMIFWLKDFCKKIKAKQIKKRAYWSAFSRNIILSKSEKELQFFF
jgi:hypothetical protein